MDLIIRLMRQYQLKVCIINIIYERLDHVEVVDWQFPSLICNSQPFLYFLDLSQCMLPGASGPQTIQRKGIAGQPKVN